MSEDNENYPIIVKGNSIKLSSNKMEIGKSYPIDYLGQKLVFVRPKEGIIDIYEVTNEY